MKQLRGWCYCLWLSWNMTQNSLVKKHRVLTCITFVYLKCLFYCKIVLLTFFLFIFFCFSSFRLSSCVLSPFTMNHFDFFFFSYHIHQSMERRISQTTPFTSFQMEPILLPYQHSLSLLFPISRVSSGLKAEDQSRTTPHPPAHPSNQTFSLSGCYLCISHLFCLCLFELSSCPYRFLCLFVWFSLCLWFSRWGSVKSSGKWPAC